MNTYKTICPDAEACPISEDIANRILCLPLYYTLPMGTIKGIAENVVEVAGDGK